MADMEPTPAFEPEDKQRVEEIEEALVKALAAARELLNKFA